MKKLTLLFALSAFTLIAEAQYPQTLPIDYKSFFAPSAIAGDSLVKAIYEIPLKSPILVNQWNSLTTGNAVIEPSTLSFSTYCDNNKGKAVLTESSRKYAIYSLTTGSQYSGKAFYLSALINLSAIRHGDFIVSFGKDYWGNYLRGKLYPMTNGKGYSLGVQSSAEPIVTGATVLNKNQTYLVVLKITPSTSGVETLSVFVNPTIGAAEPTTQEATTSTETPILRQIQAIVLRATAKGKIAGLRYSDKWADVVK